MKKKISTKSIRCKLLTWNTDSFQAKKSDQSNRSSGMTNKEKIEIIEKEKTKQSLVMLRILEEEQQNEASRENEFNQIRDANRKKQFKIQMEKDRASAILKIKQITK